MDIKEFIEKQKQFDSKFTTLSKWSDKITKDNLEVLGFLLLAVQGELGECSNIFKKIVRNDISFDSAKHDMVEEIIDSFIYLIKIVDQLDIDLEREFLAKQDKNYIKFKRMGK